MRFRFFIITLFIVFGFYWWIFPHAERPTSRSADTLHEETLASQVTKGTVVTQTPRAEPIPVVKFVGAHQGAPIPFRSWRAAGETPGHDANPMERYRGMKMSPPVEMNQRHQLVLGARAIPKANYARSMGPAAFETDGWVIVPVDTTSDANWKNLIMHANDRPVVVNPGNGRLGVVTGTLVVKLSDIHQAEVIAGRENLELLRTDERIGVAFYRAPENYALLPGAASLAKNPGVTRVEIEVLQGNKGAW